MDGALPGRGLGWPAAPCTARLWVRPRGADGGRDGRSSPLLPSPWPVRKAQGLCFVSRRSHVFRRRCTAAREGVGACPPRRCRGRSPGCRRSLVAAPVGCVWARRPWTWSRRVLRFRNTDSVCAFLQGGGTDSQDGLIGEDEKSTLGGLQGFAVGRFQLVRVQSQLREGSDSNFRLCTN